MSSRYTFTNFIVRSLSTFCITFWNVLGALVRPIGITSHSQCPYWVTKAVFSTLSSLIRSCQYPEHKSRLLNTVLPTSELIKSSALDIGNQSRTVWAFRHNNQWKNALICPVYLLKVPDLHKNFHQPIYNQLPTILHLLIY